MSQPVRYILTCPARTGSSTPISYLQAHPDICSHAEVYGPGIGILKAIFGIKESTEGAVGCQSGQAVVAPEWGAGYEK